MILSDLEYICLRIARKFVFTHNLLLKTKHMIPYYQSSQGEISPVPIVDVYDKYCREKNIIPDKKLILELGPGATNSTAYEMTARWGAKVVGYEPNAKFDKHTDDMLFKIFIAGRFPCMNRANVRRVTHLSRVDPNSIDMVFSNSVLEHVVNPGSLFAELKPLLKKKAGMIHIVDYRDHFFKYPFHFLKYSQRVWDTLLNPGDLPRARIADHLKSLEINGFITEIIGRNAEMKAFQIVKPRIHKDFCKYSEKDLATTSAVLFARKP